MIARGGVVKRCPYEQTTRPGRADHPGENRGDPRANRTGWSSIELGNACYTGYAGLTYTAERKALVRAIHSLVRKYPHRFTVIGGRGRRPLRLLELR